LRVVITQKKFNETSLASEMPFQSMLIGMLKIHDAVVHNLT
jgi:hypothetical protein